MWVDPLPNSYEKAHEVVEKITNSVLKKALGEVRPVDSVTVRDSKDTPTIQLCDVLLGAVMSAWQDATTARHMKRVQQVVAAHLGWPHLRFDTRHTERKFNVWMFHDEEGAARVARSRPVVLRHPLPPRTRQV